MNNFKVWLFTVIVTTVSVVVIGSIILVSTAKAPGSDGVGSGTPTPTASAPGQLITVTGNLTCLPHRSDNGVTTMECAFGLKSGNTYYGLGNLSQEAMNTPTETTVRVTGTLTPSSPDSTYSTVGTITVTKFEKL